MRDHITEIARSLIDDGQPLRAGDAFEIDMLTGRARRVAAADLPPEIASHVAGLQAMAREAEDDNICPDCGEDHDVPGGDPVAHFRLVCQEAGLPFPKTIEEIKDCIEILELGDRLREADERVRESYDAGRAAALRSSVKRSRTNAPGEAAPSVPDATRGGTATLGHTLMVTDVLGGPAHAFYAQSVGGAVDLMAAHLREHLTGDTLGLLVSLHDGRVDAR